jgi:pyruvate dehydrogenase E2 component (dihydrolipoamide acetyltransferase)
MPEYLLPDPGEGLTEAEIVTWKVKVGDTIAINDIVVEIETAKSLVELPSPYAGVGECAAGARGRDGRGRHPDHPDRRGVPGSRAAPAAARRPPAPRCRPQRDGPVQPGRQRWR